MTQVISVSPTTAAAVADSFKQSSLRGNSFNPLADAIAEWHDKAMNDSDIADRSILAVVQPPSLALAFLTTAPHKMQTVTPEQAAKEYKSNS